MTSLLEHINSSFSGRLKTREKRRGITQLYLPVYHEDGDMIDLFIRQDKSGVYSLSDYGMTIMRLSYEYEIDTENKERFFNSMLTEHGIEYFSRK